MTDRRRKYLETMGVTVWRARDGADEPAAGAAGPESDCSQWDPPVAAAPAADDQSADHQNLPSSASVAELSREERIATLDWVGLRAAVENCTACELHVSRTLPVFGVGNVEADWMIIGEAPGENEDRLGLPFVGRAGGLLDQMLRAIGLDRESVYIANILKSRPPNNRDPSVAEMAACWPHLARQISLVQPRMILAVGRVAAQNLLNSTTAVGKLRGRIHSFRGPGAPAAGIPLVVTYHPAYLLRSPREKRKSWDDLQMAQREMRRLREP